MLEKLRTALATSLFNSEELLQINLSEAELLADLGYGKTETRESFPYSVRDLPRGAKQ